MARTNVTTLVPSALHPFVSWTTLERYAKSTVSMKVALDSIPGTRRHTGDICQMASTRCTRHC